MSEYTVQHDPHVPRVFTVPTFGTVTFPKLPHDEVILAVPGQPEWRVSAGKVFTHPDRQVVDAGGTVVATFSWKHSRVVVADRTFDFDYKRSTLTKGPGPWEITDQGLEVMSLPRHYWGMGRRETVITIFDDAWARANPQLTLLLAWSACELSKSAQRVG